MLGVGPLEMLVIGVVALIVIGPKELPAVMRKVGQFAGMLRRMGGDFQRELNKTTGLNEIANLRNSVTAPLKATADAIRKEFNTTTATGEVKPSGVLKPADPKAESVVDEIKAAAGMTPTAAASAAAMTALTGPANPAVSIKPTESLPPGAAVPAAGSLKTLATAESPAPPETKPARVRAARVPKVAAPAPTSPVVVADIPPARRAAKAKTAIESPAPVEAIAPSVAPPKPRARKVAPSVTPAEASAPAARKPTARKSAAAKKPAADEKP